MPKNPNKINLRPAEQQRLKLTKTQQKRIKALYERAAREVAEQAKRAPRVPSDRLKKYYLKQLQTQLNDALGKIQTEMDTTVRESMRDTASAVIEDNLAFLKKVGMPLGLAFAHVPDDIVRTVATGQLYQGRWSLSSAIWKHIRKNQKDIQTIIAQGIAQNKSAYEIAKDLEKYVDPAAKKDWNWSKVYPSTCPICEARDGNYYAKDELPLDHPNGRCTVVAVIENSYEEIADRIADWVQGQDDAALDAFASCLEGK